MMLLTYRRRTDMTESKAVAPRKRRKAEPEARRQAILSAGLAVFAADGFAAAKLDDVAAKAGVAKGTIYLYFRDKEDLFEQIVRDAAAPVLDQLQGMAALSDLPTVALLAKIFEVFRTQILETDRKLVTKLVLTEGARFPKIAEFYHTEVISKGLAIIQTIAQRAGARGEHLPPELENFPHLVFAPMLLALLWDGLFSKFDPIDVEGLLSAHHKVLTASPSPKR
jgi:AcrR family transcriptional regulator